MKTASAMFLSIILFLAFFAIAAFADPVLNLSSNSLSFNYVLGGFVPASQVIALQNDGDGYLNWSAADNRSWLSVSPTNGLNGPANVSVSIDPGGLAAGSYFGTISFFSDGGDQDVTVILNVSSQTNNPPADFNLVYPANGEVNIAHSPTFRWTESIDPDPADTVTYRLVVDSDSNLSSPIIDVSGITAVEFAISSPLERGIYHWRVTADDGRGFLRNSSRWSFRVGDILTDGRIDDFEGSLVDTGMDTTLGNDDDSYLLSVPAGADISAVLSASAQQGNYSMSVLYSTNDEDQRSVGAVLEDIVDLSSYTYISFWVKGDGSSNHIKTQLKDEDGSMFGVADDDPSNLIPLSDTTWRQFVVAISALTSREGTSGDAVLDLGHIDQYILSFVGANRTASNICIDDITAVNELPPAVIRVDCEGVSFEATVGIDPDAQEMRITNVGYKELNWTISSSADWLKVDKLTGTNSEEVLVSADITGLVPALYSEVLTISAPGATNSPISIPVYLLIGSSYSGTERSIDDFEGASVLEGDSANWGGEDDGYYLFSMNGEADRPQIIQQDFPNIKHGSHAIGISLPSVPSGSFSSRGFGGVLKRTLDISSFNSLKYWIKGDGTGDIYVKLQLLDASDNLFTVSDSDYDNLANTGGTLWQEQVVPVHALEKLSGPGDSLDIRNIVEYRFVFTGTNGSSVPGVPTIFIDHLRAENSSKGSVLPLIKDIYPNPAAPGQTVTIVGETLGSSGRLEFSSGTARVSGASSKIEISSVVAGSPICSWSANEIVFDLPLMTPGVKLLKVITSDGLENDISSFVVLASTTTQTYNYPNPFNPTGGEKTNIVISNDGEPVVLIYIFDSTAEMVKRFTWCEGDAEIQWDGRSDRGQILGDGVYLYRVVKNSDRSLIGKGKILIINKQ
ncbi:MAG: hypothetical protein KKH83_01090 [Candidatus Margulisbacteria bacterium]|nr:hypothetical protein [Candidatus Margulisiibacteriota bacterium]